MLSPVPAAAFYEYMFLLARGYPADQASLLVSRRHALTRRQEILLRRCVHTPSLDEAIRGKLVGAEEARARGVVVDGYNQLLGLYALYTGEPLLRCMDGLVRDAMLAGPSAVARRMESLAALLAAVLDSLSPKRVLVVLDSQPSRSGELAAALRRRGLEAVAVRNADKHVIEEARRGLVAASSDVVVAMEAPRLFDLVAYAARLSHLERAVTDIAALVEEEHHGWCSRRGP